MTKLDFDSPRWSGLQHAYGGAEDIAQILSGMSRGDIALDDSGAIEHLWSALCHQEDIYPASFAAVPHLIDLSLRNAEIIDWNFIYLTNNIEIGRHIESAPDIPHDLLSAYVGGLKMIPELVAHLLRRPDVTGNDWSVVLAQSSAIMAGNVRLARVLNSFESGDEFFSDIEEFLSNR